MVSKILTLLSKTININFFISLLLPIGVINWLFDSSIKQCSKKVMIHNNLEEIIYVIKKKLNNMLFKTLIQQKYAKYE